MNVEAFTEAYNETRNGCNYFVQHWSDPKVMFSDGVLQCANAGCHWLLDILATELPAVFKKQQHVSNMASIHVVVRDKVGHIRAEFEDDHVAWSKSIDWTDLPTGTWNFLMAEEEGRISTILLSEY